jgi:hypothetical protein
MQFCFVELNLVQINIDFKSKSSFLKGSLNIWLNHYLVEHPVDFEQENGHTFIIIIIIIIECSFVLISLLGTWNSEISNCWKIWVIWGDCIVKQTFVSRERLIITSLTWFRQSPINKMAFSWANSSKPNKSLRFGKKTLRMYS